MSVGWGRKGLSLVAAISIVGSMFLLPAVAHKGDGRHEGRDHGRGIAVVETYDATTNQLVLATKHFGVVTLTVAETAKFGVVGWGKHFRGGGGGFHLGTEADVVPGAVVLHSKVEEGLVTKMLLFRPEVDECADELALRNDDEGEQEGCEEPDDDDDCADESGRRSAANDDHECDEPDDDECDDADDAAAKNEHEGDEEVECPDEEEPDAPEED